MMLLLCTRVDTDLTFRLPPIVADCQAWMHLRRVWIAAVVVLASVLDLLLTQRILGMVAGATGHQPAEANPFMASVVMTWWAWPLRVGIPAIAVIRDVRARNYSLMTTAAALYTCVVIWNTHMLYTVQELLR